MACHWMFYWKLFHNAMQRTLVYKSIWQRKTLYQNIVYSSKYRCQFWETLLVCGGKCWEGAGPVSCLGFAADWLLAGVYWSDQAPDQVRVFIKRPHQVFTRAAPGLAGARGGDPRQITRTSATASLSCEEMNMLALTCSRFINEIFISECDLW